MPKKLRFFIIVWKKQMYCKNNSSTLVLLKIAFLNDCHYKMCPKQKSFYSGGGHLNYFFVTLGYMQNTSCWTTQIKAPPWYNQSLQLSRIYHQSQKIWEAHFFGSKLITQNWRNQKQPKLCHLLGKKHFFRKNKNTRFNFLEVLKAVCLGFVHTPKMGPIPF